jgi:hypothetical protein
MPGVLVLVVLLATTAVAQCKRNGQEGKDATNSWREDADEVGGGRNRFRDRFQSGLGFFVAAFCSVYRQNRWAVRKYLLPRRDELMAVARELN